MLGHYEVQVLGYEIRRQGRNWMFQVLDLRQKCCTPGDAAAAKLTGLVIGGDGTGGAARTEGDQLGFVELGTVRL